VFIDIHEIFFREFPIILTEWLERLVENVGRYRDESMRNWTPELIKQLNIVINKVSRMVDLWLNSILGGYITDFRIYCTQSYIFIEREFFKGPHGKYLSALST